MPQLDERVLVIGYPMVRQHQHRVEGAGCWCRRNDGVVVVVVVVEVYERWGGCIVEMVWLNSVSLLALDTTLTDDNAITIPSPLPLHR